jgi:SPP1 gp7 family putative phage head morphogenesis protein
MDKRNWDLRRSTERQYEAALVEFGKHIVKVAKKADKIEIVVTELISITNQPWFKRFLAQASRRMVRSVLVENAQTWREAARRGTQGRQIHQMLRAEFEKKATFEDLIRGNAEMIKTLPQDLARTITQKAAREAMAGRRGEEVIKDILTEMPDLAEWKARRIARTEIAKTHAAITQIRAQELGVEYYIWRTSKDQRVRSSHKHMDGVICKFTDPPAPERLAGEKNAGTYNPGEIYNCRCFSAPIIDPDFETWPSKVYTGGQIVRMSKKRFLGLV